MTDLDSPPKYSEIPSPLSEIFEALENELVWIHGRWKMFRQLFGTNELRVQLLNDIAPTFFNQLQYLWCDYVVLEICKLTDPTTSNRNENLVISQLRKHLDEQRCPDLASALDQQWVCVDRVCGPLRLRRNKTVAHSDFATLLGSNIPIPGISRQQIEDALHAVRKYVNTFRQHYLGGEMYFQGFELIDDGTTLIYSLKCAAAFRELEDQDWTYRNRVTEGKWRNA